MISISRQKITLYSFLFLMLTNIAIVFDLKFLNIRGVASFIFLMFVPGLIVLLNTRLERLKLFEFLIFQLGISVTSIMILGLFVNWILPVLRISLEPLNLTALLIIFNIFLLMLLAITLNLNKKTAIKIKIPNQNQLSLGLIYVALFFVPLSIIGATKLNHQISSKLPMLLIFLISAYVFILTIYRKKLTETVFPISIWLISLSLMFMYSFRSEYISGWDNHLEYHVFQLTKNHQHWIPDSFPNPYNSCISITILPTIFSLFTGIPDIYILKLIYPVIFSFVPVAIYLLGRYYLTSFQAYLGAFFFSSQWMFMNQYPFIYREQTAMLFASLLFLTIFHPKLPELLKNRLLLIFGFSMVISHYSTTYLTVLVLTLSFLAAIFFKRLKFINNFHIRGVFIITLIFMTAYWNIYVTSSVNNIYRFIENNIATINLSILELKNNDTNWNLWKIGIDRQDIESKLNQYVQNLNSAATNTDLTGNSFGEHIIDQYPVEYKSQAYQPPVSLFFYELSKYLLIAITLISLTSIIYGLFVLIPKSFQILDIEISILSWIYAFILGFSLIIQSGIYNIGPTRLFQQTLLILSVPIVLGAYHIFKKITKNHYPEMTAILFIGYFLFYTTFIQELTKGRPLIPESYNLSNHGLYYDYFYTRDSEVASAAWLKTNRDNHYNIYADEVASLRLVSRASITDAKYDVIPSAIKKDAYVYLIFNNAVRETGYKKYLGRYVLSYTYPKKFLDDHKNLIYSNGDSQIYK